MNELFAGYSTSLGNSKKLKGVDIHGMGVKSH